MSRARGNGTGAVMPYTTKKGKKKYRVRITIGSYFDEDAGKVKYNSKSLGSYDTKAEAEKALAEYNTSPYDLSSKIKTVGELYAVWSEQYFEGLKNDSSIRTIKCAWAYCESISRLPLKTLGVGHIKDVMEQGYVIRKGKKKYASVDTKCRIKSIFNLMLDYAYERNLVVKNVARTFDVNDMRKEADYSRKIKAAFTQEDIDTLWKNIDDFPFIDVILIGIYTGFRPKELCELKVENVDLTNNMIIGGMKTAAGTDRKVPIIPLIKPLVEKRYIQATQRLNSQWLFNDRFSSTGTRLTYDKFRGRFKNTLIELGINGYTGHCCRVTFISKCYSAEVPEYMIKRIVGHSLKGNITDDI
jgi:integrase